MTATFDLTKLADFFPASAIEWLKGTESFDKKSARAVPYVDAREVQRRFDEVCGPENWRNEFKPSLLGNGVICAISVRTPEGHWVSKEDGAHYSEPAAGDTLEMSVKGAYTNAFKRAAVLWGVGRYLFSVNHAWVEIDENGEFVRTPTLPSAFLPAGDKSQGKSSNRSLPGVVEAPEPVEVTRRTVRSSQRVKAEPAPGGDAVDATPQAVSDAEKQIAEQPVETKQDKAVTAAHISEPASPVAEVVQERPAPPAEQAAAAAADASEAEASNAGASPQELLDALDDNNRNYVQQLLRYIQEGSNLATVHTALSNGRARDRLAPKHPQLLQHLQGLCKKRMEEAASA